MENTTTPLSGPAGVLYWAIQRFPHGTIWQTRFLAFPLTISLSVLIAVQGALSWYFQLGWFLCGILSWTLLEYVVHRWVFHYQPKTVLGTALMKRFHIVHHDDPRDQLQVCIPVILVIPAWMGAYGLLRLLGGGAEASMVGVLGLAVAMTIYDLVHFSTHYMPANNRFLKLLKRHHMQHHFVDSTRRFGVTTPVWDYVFKTI